MRRHLLGALWLAAAPAYSQQPVEVRRGNLDVKVNFTGTVIEVNTDIIRLRAAIEGRVEDIDTSTGSWSAGGRVLGHLANKEMAEILDSHSTTESGIMEDRWKQVYEPTPIACPKDCYVLRVFIKSKEWIKSKSLLAEAALDHHMVLVGRVRPEDTHWIQGGLEFNYWLVDKPEKKYTAHIANFTLDISDPKAASGGSFTLTLPRSRELPAGAQWEGVAVPFSKQDVLVVPTRAVIEYDGTAYLPIKVTTGMTTHELTEVTFGVREKQDILVLDDAELKEAMRHAYHPGEGAPAEKETEKKVRKDELKPEPLPGPKIRALPDPDATYGDDPYAQ